jgi:hypothetical protein
MMLRSANTQGDSMSHKADRITRRITKIVLILALVIGGFAFCDFVLNIVIQNDYYTQIKDRNEMASEVEREEIPQLEEHLRWDATIVMVASVFLIGSIVISLRKRRNRLDPDLDCKIGAAIESFRDRYSRDSSFETADHGKEADT